MEIILKEDIANLGYKDEVIEVKPGYGRNFLIPKGYAILATPTNKKMLNENLKQRAHKIQKEKEEVEKVAKALEGAKIVVGAKAGEQNKIFGSVNTIQLADSIAKLGFKVDRKDIKIKGDAIKQLGTYEADIRLHKDVAITVSFEVVAE
jgi:large subunit ribosomal protein L9